MPSTPEQGPHSSNPYLNAIQWGGWRWTDGAAAGTNITYAFGESGTNLNLIFGSGFGISGSWTAQQQAAYRTALQQWANVANITFTQVSVEDADLVEFVYTNSFSTTLGVHETPDKAFSSNGTAWGAYNRAGDGFTSGLQVGGYGFITLVHELGHGLGLAHPHDTGGGSSIFPGVTPFDPWDLGTNNLNQGIFTVMSYNSGWERGPSGLSPSDNYGWEMGPMAFDIAAIQALYGANTTYNAGNTTYRLPGSNVSGTGWRCIWDAGGTDAIVYGGSRDVIIDLTAATLNKSSSGGGRPSYAAGIYGGFTIANGVVIENTTAGLGDDVITGNAADNILRGGSGNDIVNGALGTDSAGFSGSKTASTFTFLSGNRIQVLGPDGFDTLTSIERLIFSDQTVTLSATMVAVNNVAITEGQAGSQTLTFTVTRSGSTAISVDYATVNSSATSGSDYVATVGTLSFATGVISRTFSVTINGDNLVEPNETFLVNLFGATNGAHPRWAGPGDNRQ